MDNQPDCRHCDMCDHCGHVEYERREPVASISKETFKELDVDAKLDVLFDYVVEIQHSAPRRVTDRDRKCQKQIKECYGRFEEIENKLMFKVIFNSAAALIGGFIGGFAAVFAHFKLGLFIH